jgi:hypothetical protein
LTVVIFICGCILWLLYLYDLFHILQSFLTYFGFMECNVCIYVRIMCLIVDGSGQMKDVSLATYSDSAFILRCLIFRTRG